MFTLHRLLLGLAEIVVVSGTLLLSSAPLMAGSSGYQGIRHYGGHRSSTSHSARYYRGLRSGSYYFIRPRSARYNSWYPWRRKYYGNHYNYYRNYGNNYRGDTYGNTVDTGSDNAEYDFAYFPSDTVDTASSDIRLGWSLLARGDVHNALNTFSIQTRHDPSNSILKVGYALAVAETGDLHKGVSAMRGALRSDPDSLHLLILDEDLQGIVKSLIYRYEDDSSHTSLAIAARNFMIAALYYLLGDAESAGLILPAQDTDSSTRNLDRLIQQSRSNG